MVDNALVKGDEVNTITTFEKLRTAMIDLLRGYPIYWYYGIIESYFEENLGDYAVEILNKDRFIEIRFNEKENNRKEYRLTEKGVGVVTALLNQKNSDEVFNYNKKVLKYTQETHHSTNVSIWFTEILTLMTFGLFIFAFAQALITLWF